ncbi:MAG: hypothetical protein QM764_12035 [Chitinophagaceae bacterium]
MFYFDIIASYSIIFAAAIGIIRFKKIHKSYRPFVIICIVALLNETISYLSIYTFGNNEINNNIYSLVEAILYLWLFRGWGVFGRGPFLFMACLLSVIWIVNNLVSKYIADSSFRFLTIYSCTLVFFAITEINRIVMSGRGNLFRDSRFLICAGIVIFYTYTSIVGIFWITQLNLSTAFYSNLYMVLQSVNILINLVFALAVLWAPQRLRFILRFDCRCRYRHISRVFYYRYSATAKK